jgi:hypothetical protein
MLHQRDVYIDLEGREICLKHLDPEEQKLLARIRRRAAANPDWNAFDNYWIHAIRVLYESRGMTPAKAVLHTVLWRVAEDLSGRIAMATEWARPGDYRGDLEELIRAHFPSQRAFCKAAGLSEDMLSHFLAGRKDLSLASLEKALARLGYHLRIAPVPKVPTPKSLSARPPKRAARSA